MFKFLLGIMKKRKTVSSDSEVHVHPLTYSSTFAWQEIRVHQQVEKVAPMDPSTPILADHIRFVCLSDTHLKIEKGQIKIPDGDVLLHSGDFTNTGLPSEVKTFNDFLDDFGVKLIHYGTCEFVKEIDKCCCCCYGFDTIFQKTIRCMWWPVLLTEEKMRKNLERTNDPWDSTGSFLMCPHWPSPRFADRGTLPHKLKIVIAGNHDLSFDYNLVKNDRQHLSRYGWTRSIMEAMCSEYGITGVKKLMTNCVYLQDSGVSVCGINIWGSPWQPAFCDWGFNLERGQPLLDKWNLIPESTDILITHGPPVGYGDRCFDGQHVGCVELLSTVQQRVHPKYHLFGHIHEGYGMTTDGYTTFINASTCTVKYKPTNPPVVFDIPVPKGFSKADLIEIKLLKPLISETITTASLTSTASMTTAAVSTTTAAVPVTTSTVPVLLETITAAPLTISKEPMTTSTFLVTKSTFPMTASTVPLTTSTVPQTISTVPITASASQD